MSGAETDGKLIFSLKLSSYASLNVIEDNCYLILDVSRKP